MNLAGFFVHIRIAYFFLLAFSLAAQKPSGEVERLYEQGEHALAEHRYEDAERTYEKLGDLAPGMAEVHAQLGVVYFQESKFEQALPRLRQALKLKPGLPNVDTLLAMSLSELGQYREALPGLERGFHKSIDTAMRRMSGLQLERAYTGLQQDSKAVEVALEMRRLYPNDPEVLYQTGKLFGNYAFLTMQKLAEVAPDSTWRHQAAGEAYESEGNYTRAVEEYRKCWRTTLGGLGLISGSAARSSSEGAGTTRMNRPRRHKSLRGNWSWIRQMRTRRMSLLRFRVRAANLKKRVDYSKPR